ncbi:MAG: helix-turn-helix domain-containing protein [Candidatus Latescibacter sp.]|nr:helix-turn-helix domain-containing protein [Candidatus Latescibacter sp.]
MPRISPFKIVLTDEEQQSLSSMTRKYTAPYRDVIRAQVILLAAEGLENNEIGKKLNLPRKTVSKWRKRFFNERERGLVERPRMGRPFAFSPCGDSPNKGTCLPASRRAGHSVKPV